MPRIPRLRRLFAVATVLALTVVPLASARPVVERPAVHEADGGLVGVAWKWVEDLVGFRRSTTGPGRPGQVAPRQDTKVSLGGSCIDPQGYPKPCPR